MTADQVKVTYPVDALVSFHYYRDDKVMAPLVETGRLRLIGDSGAFSAMTQGSTIRLDDYVAWVKRWQQDLLWAASLDVIGDPHATLTNWRTLRDRYGLDTVPTVHAGTPVKWLDVYARDGATLVGLGGMAGTGQAPRAFRWAVAMFRYARDRWPDVRFHLWGVTNRQFLDSLPAWSADSSGILGAAYRYAQLRLFDPATGQHHNVALRGDRAVYRLSGLLRKVYGVDPAEIERSHPGNRTTLIRLATAATQQYAGWLQRRHKVTPPVSLADRFNAGPTLHLVSSAAGGVTDDLTTAVTGVSRRVPGGGGSPPPPDRHLPGSSRDDHTPPPGPRLHLVDAAIDKLGATVRETP